MKKKLVIILSALVLVLLAGGWYAKHLVTEKIFNQVETALKDPEIQKEIAQLDTNKLQDELKSINTDKLAAEAGATSLPSTSGSIKSNSNSPSPTNSSKVTNEPAGNSTTKPNQSDKTTTPAKDKKPSEGPTFNSRDDAANYAMKKFSASEIIHYMSVYKNKNNMTKEEKQEAKAEILSRFSSEEIKALTEAAK